MSTEPHKAAPDDQDTFNDQPEAAAPEAAAPEGAAPSEAADPAPAEGAEAAELKEKYLRLLAEFENYKRRTSKERAELFRSANQELMIALLPVLDDFDRARQHTATTTDVQALRDGLEIVHNKLTKTLYQKGLQPMDAVGQAFDAELHEAITQIPAASAEERGKIVDAVERGYYLNDKVLRHAKVVLGS